MKTTFLLTHKSFALMRARLPSSPGVYVFKNSESVPIYIGKASKLKTRVASYFQKDWQAQNPQKRGFLEHASSLEIHPTQSEIEALVLESRLIKTYKPKYNIAMRDDKQYFYVAFTKEVFPKLVITHQGEKMQRTKETRLWKLEIGNSLIGPFTDGRALKITLRLLRKVFPFCTCGKPHKRFCLNYHLGIDAGYCCVINETSQQKKNAREYKNNVTHIKRILRGQKTRVLSQLKQNMGQAARKQDFETAAVLRNQWEGFQNVLAHKIIFSGASSLDMPLTLAAQTSSKTHAMQSEIDILLNHIHRIEGYDISNIQGSWAVGSMVVFEKNTKGDFTPKKSDYRRFKIKTINGANDPAMMGEVITRRLRHSEWPSPGLMLIDGGITQRNAASKALEASIVSPRVFGLAKREEELYTGEKLIRLSSLPQKQALLFRHIRDEAHRFAIGYYRKLHAKSMSRQ